jgi:hypothetical protein
MGLGLEVLFSLLVVSYALPMYHNTPTANGDLISKLPGLNYSVPFLQYAGFVQVDPLSNRNLFYWYVQSSSSPSTGTI